MMRLPIDRNKIQKFLDRRHPYIIIIGVTVISFLRAPSLFLHPRFWAEEGAVYFIDALKNPFFLNLFTPKLSYISLFNNAIAGIAAVVPLSYGPLVTTVAAFAVYLTLFVFLIMHDAEELSSPINKIIATLVMLFSFPSHEVWLSSASSQFIMALGSSLILISPMRSRRFFLLSSAFSILATLTGPVSILLSPFFILKALIIRNKRNIILGVIFFIGGAVQFITFLVSNVMPRGGHDPLAFFMTISYRLFIVPLLGPFIGRYVALSLHDPSPATVLILSVCLLTIICCILYIIIKRRSVSGIIILVASITLAFLSFFGALADTDPWYYMNVYIGGRYFYVPVALLGFAIVLSIFKTNTRKKDTAYYLASFLTALFIFWGAVDFFKPYNYFYRGPDWRTEVARWNAIGKCPIRIWPWGWKTELPHQEGDSSRQASFLIGNSIRCDGDPVPENTVPLTSQSITVPIKIPDEKHRFMEVSLDSSREYILDFIDSDNATVDRLYVKAPIPDSGLFIQIVPLNRFTHPSRWKQIRINANPDKDARCPGHLAYW